MIFTLYMLIGTHHSSREFFPWGFLIYESKFFFWVIFPVWKMGGWAGNVSHLWNIITGPGKVEQTWESIGHSNWRMSYVFGLWTVWQDTSFVSLNLQISLLPFWNFFAFCFQEFIKIMKDMKTGCSIGFMEQQFSISCDSVLWVVLKHEKKFCVEKFVEHVEKF